MSRPYPRRPKFGRRSSRELGARLLAWFCLLLVAVASTAQSVHVHGSYAPSLHAVAGQHDAGAVVGDESVCPLCMAMHSAMPATLSLVPAAADLWGAIAPAFLAVFVREPAHFAAFSRPPPAFAR